MKKINIIIIGMGDQGKIIKHLVELFQNSYNFLGFVDDNTPTKCLGKVNNLSLLKKKLGNFEIFIAIARNSIREKIFKKIQKSGFEPASIIHPTALVEKGVKLGKNVFLGAKAVININSVIEDGVFINTGCIIEHDSIIKSFSHLAPGVIMGGGVKIGKRSFIGLGSKLSDHIKIGNDTFIAMGSVVNKSIKENDRIYGGIPAKNIKINKQLKDKYI